MVTIYRTETCPRCHVLKAKLESKGIEYTENTNENEMQQLGIMSVPQLEKDGELLNFVEAIAWVNSL
jgi:glutaredoxin